MGSSDLAFERKLYVIRKRAESAIRYSGKVPGGDFFYISSLSFKTVVYKGMLLTTQLNTFYPDLTHPAMTYVVADDPHDPRGLARYGVGVAGGTGAT